MQVREENIFKNPLATDLLRVSFPLPNENWA